MLCFFALTKGAWVGIGIGIFAIIVIVAAVIVNRRDKIKARRKQAGKDLKVGKYTVLTADGSDSFNIRVNGLVREIKHGDVLILGEGDTFCPVSHTVVLR